MISMEPHPLCEIAGPVQDSTPGWSGFLEERLEAAVLAN